MKFFIDLIMEQKINLTRVRHKIYCTTNDYIFFLVNLGVLAPSWQKYLRQNATKTLRHKENAKSILLYSYISINYISAFMSNSR